jgi:hypothetical protein
LPKKPGQGQEDEDDDDEDEDDEEDDLPSAKVEIGKRKERSW